MDDPVLKKILNAFEFSLKWYDSRESWARWLKDQNADELQIVLDNWQWPERQLQKRLLEEELNRRRPNLLEAMAQRQKDLGRDGTRPRETRRQSLEEAPKSKEEQPADAPKKPSWWQEHKNQIYVGLLVGIPTLLVTAGLGILALIFSG